MRIAMTGGGGFVGSRLLERLVDDGHDVVLVGSDLGMSGRAARLLADGRVISVRADTAGPIREVRRALSGGTHLVLLGYLATGPTRSRLVRDELAPDVAVNRILVRAARGLAGHIVYASSTSVYGAPAHLPVEETDRPSPEGPYASAKLASERAVRRVASAYGIPATILRYATAYGPGDTPPAVVATFVRAGLDRRSPEIEGDGLDEDDYVYVDDIVAATVRAIELRADGTYNVGTGVGTSTLTLARAVLHLTQADVEPVFRLPRRPDRPRMVCSTTLASKELGFIAWPRLHSGIQNQIASVRASGAPPSDAAAD